MSQLARALAVILGAQLAGEIGVRALGVPVPGPVLGMALLAIAFAALPRLADLVRPAAEGLLAHLSILFVPAGVGVVGHLGALGSRGPALLTAVVLSTALAIAAGALAFAAVARLTGNGAGDAPGEHE